MNLDEINMEISLPSWKNNQTFSPAEDVTIHSISTTLLHDQLECTQGIRLVIEEHKNDCYLDPLIQNNASIDRITNK